MLKWFREAAPIRLKMSWAFGLQAVLIIVVTGLMIGRSFGLFPLSVALVGAGSALGISYALGFVLKAAICDPYVTTVVRMEKLAAGDLDSPILFTGNADCVGRMTKAMFAFRDNALAKIKADADSLEAQRRAEEARRFAEETAIEKQIALVSNSIGAGLDRLAQGDLTARLDDPLPGAYEKLRTDFNSALATLQDIMGVVAANTRTIRGGGEEISQAADDLSRRTEKQAASLEETAAALDEITATVKKTAEGAKNANMAVTAAKQDAEHSGEVVRQAVQAMSAIEQSSRQISQIIGVIDEIAFQTNLLALNAGVEAARAGDAGRGFAVVASEVRALAQRSAEAAKEIKALISASGRQVSEGVDLVGETGQSLSRIVVQVAQINTLVTEIAASAQEQSAGLAQVNIAVNQMDQMTQQNAAMVEQSTAASHALSQEAEELSRLIARFNVGEAATDFRASKPKPRATLAMGRGELTTRRRGSAALAVVHPEASESWEEF